ncbi:MAG TPA: UDP-N-acetylmuramyl-tripeptide synthetase, partial [Candidatus Cloacimonadota bacterium]|nr:UDP-N-acetylmuramyl-tripeptide synthetase [Candidatus Cloacimonadota bacterium]
NLSRDHLDFHKNMDEYFSAKYMLFERAIQNSAVSVVNIDDDHGRIIADRLKSTGAGIFSVGHISGADYTITDTQTRLDGSYFKLVCSGDEMMEIASPLIGSFNVDNLALALGTLLAAKHDKARLTELVERLKPVPGRIEAVTNDLGIGIYVDYAHTPDAIINLLKSINKLPHGRVISVIGAGGNRDTGKRPLMLQAALRHSDAVIITDDNPRDENPNLIIQDIVRDRELSLPWWIIRDRGTAIASAIKLARRGDVVLICGKGHENYQEIKGVRHHFDDRGAARKALLLERQNKADDEMLLSLDPLMLAIVEELPLDENCDFDGASYRHLSMDSRSIKPESMFFAIKGENFDGNRFISNVLKQDSCFAVGTIALPDQKRYYQTSDSLLLMAKLMQKYLLMFDIHKTALTGSTGKTSTKELLTAILEDNAPTLKTLKNENNIIGLCKTILRIEPNHRFGVFEIGTNHFGEIARLSDIIMPDAGIILNVGPSHLEYFGDEDGVMREKTDLFHRALDLRLYPADDPRFEIYHESGKSVGYAEDAAYQISDVREEAQGKSFVLCGIRYTIPYSAPHYVINGAFAIAMALNLGIEPREIQIALHKPVALDMRMQVENLRGGYLIVDCYNANPMSMQSALEYWRDLHPEMPHVAFLGDMLELGTQADMYHQMIGAM